ncbi:MAG: hypothetical protein K5891_08340 [Lachnospiraceae bacterium]|nr:hypothetical protein [Lachnospiraceae bacterium]
MKKRVFSCILPLLLLTACGSAEPIPEEIADPGTVEIIAAPEEAAEPVEASSEEPSVETSDEEESSTLSVPVSLEDLEAAKQYTYQDFYTNEVEGEYFFVGTFDGSDAELFGRTDYEWYVARIGDRLIEIPHFVDNNPPSFLVSGDFDRDGEAEYGFTVCDGRGTGFYVESLTLIDQGATEPVITFCEDDLIYGDSSLFDCVKTEVNEEKNTLDYRLETGDSVSDVGTLELPGYMAEETCSGLYFGDIFRISYSDGVWYFDAVGGSLWTGMAMPEYEDSLHLMGRLIIRNGEITFSVPAGVQLLPDWATMPENESTGTIVYGNYTDEFLFNFGGYRITSESFVPLDCGSGTPEGWNCLGGSGICIDPGYAERETFADGILTDYHWVDNHTLAEKVDDFVLGENSCVLYRYSFDLYTATQTESLPAGTPLTTEYWVLFFTRGEERPLYVKYFNCEYYAEDQVRNCLY